MWTVNGSWAAGAARMGTLQKQRIRYIIGGGYAARFAMIWLLARPRAALGAREPGGMVTKLLLLFARLLMDLLPMAAFALAGFGLLSATEPPRAASQAFSP